MARISSFAIIAAAGFLAGSASAFAQTAQPQPAAQPASDPDAIVCRAGDPVTGTRLPGPRECHTQRQWDDMRQQSQDALSHVQMNSDQSNPNGG